MSAPTSSTGKRLLFGWGVPAAVGLAGFAMTAHWLSPAPSAPQATQSPKPTSEQGRAQSSVPLTPQRPSVGPRPNQRPASIDWSPEIRSDRYEAWNEAASEAPLKVQAVQTALGRAVDASMDSRNASVYDCNADDEMVGHFVLRFETDVAASQDELTASPLRFVAVRDGSPLSPETIACLETALGGPYEIRRSENERPFLDGFQGPVPFVYRIRVEPLEP